MGKSLSVHGAAGQALGYFHQCMWALIELGKRASVDPMVELRLEALDDLQFDQAGSPTELLQTKHHVGAPKAITSTSVDVWRTLNVWMDLPRDLNPILRLVTTSILPSDSDLAGLRLGEHRNTADAVDALTNAAETSTNQATEKWRHRFLALDPSERESLVMNIVLNDSSPQAARLEENLTLTFRYAITPGQEAVFYDLLRGWWTGIAVRLLDRSLESVTGNDLIVQISDIVDQLRTDTLPIDPAVLEPFSESSTGPYRSRRFVQQLSWIALDNTRLWKAIRDYHRSFTQRSFWLRHQLLSETELDRFAFQLHDEWEQIFDTRVYEMTRDGRIDVEAVGQEIFTMIAHESRAKLRDRFEAPWFNRGMFHALADGEVGEQIGWHPEFVSKLEEILSDVAS